MGDPTRSVPLSEMSEEVRTSQCNALCRHPAPPPPPPPEYGDGDGVNAMLSSSLERFGSAFTTLLSFSTLLLSQFSNTNKAQLDVFFRMSGGCLALSTQISLKQFRENFKYV